MSVLSLSHSLFASLCLSVTGPLLSGTQYNMRGAFGPLLLMLKAQLGSQCPLDWCSIALVFLAQELKFGLTIWVRARPAEALVLDEHVWGLMGACVECSHVCVCVCVCMCILSVCLSVNACHTCNS